MGSRAAMGRAGRVESGRGEQKRQGCGESLILPLPLLLARNARTPGCCSLGAANWQVAVFSAKLLLSLSFPLAASFLRQYLSRRYCVPHTDSHLWKTASSCSRHPESQSLTSSLLEKVKVFLLNPAVKNREFPVYQQGVLIVSSQTCLQETLFILFK